MRKLTLSSALFLLTLCLAGSAKATPITYNLTIDQCTGGCGTPTSLGNGVFATVSLNQVGANVVVTETLANGEGFVKTGAGNALEFNLSVAPTSISDITSGFTNSGPSTASAFGSFNQSIFCSGCGNGASSPLLGPLTFTVNGVALADFVANSRGYYFASDIIGVNGNTGNVGSDGPSRPVASTPEPESFLLFGSGLIGIAVAVRQRRRV